MGEVTLKIGADVQGALNGTEKLNKSVDELNKDTQAYNQRATQGFNQTGQAATNASQGVSKATQAFKLMGGAVAAAFSVGAIIQFGKAVVSSTDAGADAMERFRMGAESAFTFLRQSIGTMDFSNILNGFEEAYQAGKKFADSLDELEDRRRALSGQTKDIDLEIIRQRTIARTYGIEQKDKEAAVNEVIRLEELKLKKTKEITEKALKDLLDFADTNKKINEQEILDIIKNYDQYVDRLNEGAALAAELADIKSKISSGYTSPEGILIMQEGAKTQADYNKRLAELTPLQKENIRLSENFNLVVGEQRDAIIAAYNANVDADIALANSAESLTRIKNSLLRGEESEKDKAAKADKERTKSTVEENLATLDKYIEDANKKIFDIELGFGGEQSAEQFQKQIEDNIDSFNKAMAENPMFSDENGAQAKAYDEAQQAMKENAELLQKQQQEAFEKMQKFAEDHPIAEALGLTSEEQLSQIKDYVGQLFDFAQQIVDQQVEATERIVEDQNQRIEEQEQLVNREFELKQEGLANNYQVEQENLAKMQKARDQAIKDREKAIKLQRSMSVVESGIALVASAANIIKGFSGIPIVGVVLGLAAVAAMIAGFVAAQGKVKDATQMARGGQAGLLKGPRHSQGGIHIEAEGGEWFINRKSSMKYSPLLDAINKDDREGMRLFFDRKFINRMPQQKLFDIDKSKKLGEIARNTRKPGYDIQYGPGYIIERTGNYTKKINLN